MDLSNISVNAQSSIRIAGSCVLYFDAFQVSEESHDADYIFITHDHFDHFDPASIAKIRKNSTVIVTPEAMKEKVLKESGIAKENCIFLTPGSSTQFGVMKVGTVAAYNVLKPFHMKHAGWQGYLVTMDDVTYYVAGDTDPNDDNRKVKCDVALVPVGGKYTMDAEKAAKFVLELAPKAAIPTHYGAVVGSPEDGERFKEAVGKENSGIQVETRL